MEENSSLEAAELEVNSQGADVERLRQERRGQLVSIITTVTVHAILLLLLTLIFVSLGPEEVPQIVAITEKGLNMIGKIPWLIAVPPGPLGIAYILLNLLEECPWCPTEDQLGDLNQQCADLLAQQLAQPVTIPSVVRPSSTQDCQPPEANSGCPPGVDDGVDDGTDDGT